jgi:hypothetical protein
MHASGIFFATASTPTGSEKGKEPRAVPKPPQATPHSDLDGVHRDEKSNVDSANEAGQDTSDLQRAHEGSKARPDYSSD